MIAQVTRHGGLAIASLAAGVLAAGAVASRQAQGTAAANAPMDPASLFSYLTLPAAAKDPASTNAADAASAQAAQTAAIFGVVGGAVAAVALFGLLEMVAG